MFAEIRERAVARLPKSRVARAILTLASGTAAAQLIVVCAMPIVTRLYTPAQIGVISLFLAFFLFWAPAQSLRYEYALLIAHDDAESHVVYRLSTLCVCMMSLLALPVLTALQQNAVLGFGELPWWAAPAALPILFAYGQFMVLRSWALRAGMIKDVTHAAVARSAAKSVSRVGLGLLWAGVPALFAAELIGAWGAFLKLHRKVALRYARNRPNTMTLGSLWTALRRYIKFPLFETPSTLVNQLALALPIPMIASLYGVTAAGWYGIARAMVVIPNTQVGGAVADVLQMELAAAVRAGERARGRRIFYRLLGKLSLFGLLPLVGTILLGPWLVPLILGHAWAQAGWVAALIAPWLYAALVVSSLSRVLSVLQAQEFKLVYDIVAVSFFVGAFLAAKRLQLDFLPMVAALSVAGVVAYVVYLIVLLAVVERRLRGCEDNKS